MDFDQIVSLYLSHAVNGTVVNGVDSRRWQDWTFGLNEPMSVRVTDTVTDTVTATVTATVKATVTATATDTATHCQATPTAPVIKFIKSHPGRIAV